MAAVNIGHYFQQHLAMPGKVLYRHFSAGAWRDVAVSQIASMVGRWQSAFRSLGLEEGERVGICLKNDIDWVALDLAALGLGLVVLPLYADDNPDNVAWCVTNAEARLLIIETARMAVALRHTGAALPSMYVLRSEGSEDLPSVTGLLGRETDAVEFRALSEHTLATICYTSGTSGRPKGVMLSHGNIIANVEQCRKTGMARADDTFLSVLPLSHMFERTGGYYLPLAIGAKVVFARGIAHIADDLATQAPTIMFAVPRIFERFHGRINESLATAPAKRWLFDQCATRGWRVAQGSAGFVDALAAPVLRALVAKRILSRLGGRMRLTVVGGAALDPAIAHTFIGLGLSMLQGYGMTEASPVISVNRDDDNDPDSVGRPLPGVEVEVTEGRELRTRGANVMQGYWRNPEATNAAIDAEGWLRTGDLAELNEGRIYLRGRAKDILVMSNGEKLSPQDVEFALLHDAIFEQVMLVGEGRPFLTLLAVTKEADEQRLLKRANDRLNAFPRWVRIRRVVATSEAWTVDNGLLTPTLKLKRPLVVAKLKAGIEAAYSDA